MNDLKGKRVLVVEDDSDTRAWMEAACRNADFELITSESADDALAEYEKAVNAKRPYDLILADLNLRSDKTGVDLVKSLRERSCKARIIFVTGHEEDADYRTAGRLLGVFETWKKPLPNFKQKIEKVLLMPNFTDERRDQAEIPTHHVVMSGSTFRDWLNFALLMVLVILSAFTLYRSTFTAPAIIETRNYIRAVTLPDRAGKTIFRANVPPIKSAYKVLSNGRSRITFEMAPEDAEKIAAIASDRNKSYVVCVGK